MSNQNSDYEINEKDIETVLAILKASDSENATPEMAISILEHLQASVHELGHTNPELLLQMYEDLKKEKQSKKTE